MIDDETATWYAIVRAQLSTLKTDRYGRALFGARIADGNLRGSTTAPGFQPQEFVATCAGSYDPRELRIELKPR